MGELLDKLPRVFDERLLVGFDTRDDAAVYRLDASTAVVTTADIITPPVDDPHTFGRIAAANALSDVFAMGGRPITALHLAGFPSKVLPTSVLGEILAGSVTAITEAGAVLAGGHTTDDEEPKFGLAVTGLVHPDRVWRNAGARPGDALVLSKPIGAGVLLNANRKGWVSQEAMAVLLSTLCRLNRDAAEAARSFEVHAATDVTGFGLAGHAWELAHGSGVRVVVQTEAIPVFAEAAACYARGMGTGVNKANLAQVEPHTTFSVAASWVDLLVDPQTNGGLLLAVPAAQADDLVGALSAGGDTRAARIGTVEAGAGLQFA